ncbi:MAG TPA: hypothetical protein VFO39_19475 [Candidatus Sulfotelmatobacter sp.]|nr:hypothetical protein [Candidatus Sulfotelmatobacter sp.]
MVLISFALLMPTMAAIWLGLNVVRFYSYDGEAGNLIYLTVIGLQSAIEFSVVVVACLVVLWSAIELVGLLAKRASHT